MKTYTPALAALGLLITTPCFAGTITVPDDYATIQAAVDAAVPGDTILVEAGTYSESVRVSTDDLTIREADEDSNPVIDAAGGLFGLLIDAGGVTVEGLEARNATGGEDEAYGFLVLGDNNELRGNAAVANTHGFGVIGAEGGGTGNTLTGNLADGNIVAGFEVVLATDCVIEDNIAQNTDGPGFLDGAGTDNRFDKNLAVGNVFGFLIAESVGSSVSKNVANDNIVDGFNINFCDGIVVSKNRIDGTFVRDGIRLNAVTNSLFEKNTIKNVADGFSIDQAPEFGGLTFGNSLEKNDSRSNGGFGYNVNEASLDNVFDRNKAKDNELGCSNVAGICD